MDDETLDAIRGLLDSERVLTVAVLVDGEPHAALLPYALLPDRSALLVHVSGLARHSKGLLHGASVGVLVHAAATPERDPMQIPRLSVQATVHGIERDSEAFSVASEELIRRFPQAATTLALGDFRVYALVLGRGRFVQGFARAVNVGPDTFRSLDRS